VKLGGEWKEYAPDEDKILKQSYLSGFANCRFTLRGSAYEYSFERMVQKNLTTGKERQIRAPHKWCAPPEPIVPHGPTICVKVPSDSAGQRICIDHPRIDGGVIMVDVPENGKVGAPMLVPVPSLAVASDKAVKGVMLPSPFRSERKTVMDVGTLPKESIDAILPADKAAKLCGSIAGDVEERGDMTIFVF